MLRNACEDLREEFDLLSTERMNIANKNFLPKYADARENPSRKVLIFFLKCSLFCSLACIFHQYFQGSYKISALKMQYEIFVSTQWLDLKLRKLKFEEKVCFAMTVSLRLENLILQIQKKLGIFSEVKELRSKISDLKVKISTTTKGIPVNLIEVRMNVTVQFKHLK